MRVCACSPLSQGTFPAEKRDGAQVDVDILAHLISLFEASKRQKNEGLASIEAEVSEAQVQPPRHAQPPACCFPRQLSCCLTCKLARNWAGLPRSQPHIMRSFEAWWPAGHQS